MIVWNPPVFTQLSVGSIKSWNKRAPENQQLHTVWILIFHNKVLILLQNQSYTKKKEIPNGCESAGQSSNFKIP